MRRRVLQNSPEASTSTTAVLTRDRHQLAAADLLPCSLTFASCSKKYFALPLCTMSNSVPAATRTIMTHDVGLHDPGRYGTPTARQTD